jgi:chromosome segregation protein
LDDANVERFIQLIKELSAKSQFLIVTHNKRTMEAADYIFGVTMDEPSVTTIYSWSMKDVESKLKEEK